MALPNLFFDLKAIISTAFPHFLGAKSVFVWTFKSHLLSHLIDSVNKAYSLAVTHLSTVLKCSTSMACCMQCQLCMLSDTLIHISSGSPDEDFSYLWSLEFSHSSKLNSFSHRLWGIVSWMHMCPHILRNASVVRMTVTLVFCHEILNAKLQQEYMITFDFESNISQSSIGIVTQMNSTQI